MKRVVIGFLVLMLAISTRGIAFDQAKDCETVAECLQRAIEKDNKLEKENLLLKKNIEELQDKLNSLADATKCLQNDQEETKKQFQSHKHEITNIDNYINACGGCFDHIEDASASEVTCFVKCVVELTHKEEWNKSLKPPLNSR